MTRSAHLVAPDATARSDESTGSLRGLRRLNLLAAALHTVEHVLAAVAGPVPNGQRLI